MTETGSPSASRGTPSIRRRRLAGLAALLGAAVLAAVYGIGSLKRNAAGDAGCAPAIARAQTIAPLALGEVAALTVATTPLRVPDLAFTAADGTSKKLSDWRGQTVLLNLWATWCVPCRKEMPALDRLQGRLGGGDFNVVAINIDTRDAEKPKAFLKDAGLDRLGFFADPSAKVFQELKAVGRALGMPTSMLIDANGCEIGTIAGGAEWDSADAIRLVEAARAK